MLMISAECLTGKSNSPVMEAPEPSFFLFTLNTRIVLPFANAVINALKQNIYYNRYLLYESFGLSQEEMRCQRENKRELMNYYKFLCTNYKKYLRQCFQRRQTKLI